MTHIKQVEKMVAEGMAMISALLLALIVSLFVMEIVMRYFLDSPTRWSNDVISFIMPTMIFFALPEVTRRNQHIAITFILDSVHKPVTFLWRRLLALASAVVSGLVGWIIASSALKQFSTGILTNTVIQAPKWVLLTPIVVSFATIAIIFFITALTGRDET